MENQQRLIIYCLNKEGFSSLTHWARHKGYNPVTALSAQRRHLHQLQKRHIHRDGKPSITCEIIASLTELIEKHQDTFTEFKNAA